MATIGLKPVVIVDAWSIRAQDRSQLTLSLTPNPEFVGSTLRHRSHLTGELASDSIVLLLPSDSSLCVLPMWSRDRMPMTMNFKLYE